MSDEKSGQGYSVSAVICLIIAMIFGIFGLWRMHIYRDTDHIVGGDAYNYTILATRGVGLVCLGVLFAIVAVVFMLMRVAALQSPVAVGAPVTEEPEPTPTDATGRMVVCWNCGKDYPDGLKTCPHCGKAIALSPIYR